MQRRFQAVAAVGMMATLGCSFDPSGITFAADGSPGPGRGPDAAVDASNSKADAKPLPPDARPLVPDAQAPMPDAQASMPDAMTTPDASIPSWVQLLENPGFEDDDDGWEQESNLGYTLILPAGSLSITPHQGEYAVWFGGVSGEIATVSQGVSLPADATGLRMSGYLRIAAGGQIESDQLDIEIHDAYGDHLETLGTFAGQDSTAGWEAFAFVADLVPAGQQIHLVIHSETSNDPASFYVDTLALEALTAVDIE